MQFFCPCVIISNHHSSIFFTLCNCVEVQASVSSLSASTHKCTKANNQAFFLRIFWLTPSTWVAGKLSFREISLSFERNFELFSSFLSKNLTDSNSFLIFLGDFWKFCLSFAQISLSLVKILSFLRLEFCQKSQKKKKPVITYLPFIYWLR